MTQDRGPPGAEVLVGDEAVLLADGRRVFGVVRGASGEYGQVGVAQDGAVAVAVIGVVADGEAYEAGDLGRTVGADAVASGRARSASWALRSSFSLRSGR